MTEIDKIKKRFKIAIIIATAVLSVVFIFIGFGIYNIMTDVPHGHSQYNRRIGEEGLVTLEVTKEATIDELLSEVTNHVVQLEDVIALDRVTIRLEDDFSILSYRISYSVKLSENTTGFLTVSVTLDDNRWQISGGDIRYNHNQRQIEDLLPDDVRHFMEQVMDYLDGNPDYLLGNRLVLNIWRNSVSLLYGHHGDMIIFKVNRDAEIPLLEKDNSRINDEKTDEYASLIDRDDITSATIQIRNATEIDFDQLDDYYEFVDPNEPMSYRIIITTDTPVFDFKFVELEFTEIANSDGGTDRLGFATILYSIEKLHPETPFVVNWTTSGVAPHRGIIFSDGESSWFDFSIQQSSYDGGMFLGEREELYWRWLSPRTDVIGLLEESKYPWSSISVTHFREGITYMLSYNDGNKVYEILSTMYAVEILTPFHYERQSSSPLFIVEITFSNGDVQIINTVEGGRPFFRFTDTVGNMGDYGYVIGKSDGNSCELLYEILMAYFEDVSDQLN